VSRYFVGVFVREKTAIPLRVLDKI